MHNYLQEVFDECEYLQEVCLGSLFIYCIWTPVHSNNVEAWIMFSYIKIGFILGIWYPKNWRLKKNINENKNHFVSPLLFWKSFENIYLYIKISKLLNGDFLKYSNPNGIIRSIVNFHLLLKLGWGCPDFMFNSLTSKHQHAGLIYCFHDNTLIFWDIYGYTCIYLLVNTHVSLNEVHVLSKKRRA